jgi:hypothetical protein
MVVTSYIETQPILGILLKRSKNSISRRLKNEIHLQVNDNDVGAYSGKQYILTSSKRMLH